MSGRRRFGDWWRGSQRKRAAVREKQIADNRRQVLDWAYEVENALPGFSIFRIAGDPQPLKLKADNGLHLSTPYHFWQITEDCQYTQAPLPVISKIEAWWIFASDGTLWQLRVRFKCYELGPQVADALTHAADAAQLIGWTEADSRTTHRLLIESLSAMPNQEVVSGEGRLGLILLRFKRQSSSKGMYAELVMMPVDHSRRGFPLGADGVEVIPR